MRRTIDDPGFVHGDNGYRMGCGCGTCTEAQRTRRARYEDRKRRGQLVETASGPGVGNTTTSASDFGLELVAGVLREKARIAVHEVKATGAEAELLREQALTGARIVDEAVASGRPHLVAAGNRILNESLDRLKALGRLDNDHQSQDVGDDFLKRYI